MSRITSAARKIVTDILADILERGGMADEWHYIDPDTQDEIVECWVEIVEQRLFREGL